MLDDNPQEDQDRAPQLVSARSPRLNDQLALRNPDRVPGRLDPEESLTRSILNRAGDASRSRRGHLGVKVESGAIRKRARSLRLAFEACDDRAALQHGKVKLVLLDLVFAFRTLAAGFQSEGSEADLAEGVL